MTSIPAPRPDDSHRAGGPRRSPEERDRARVRLTRKWAYLVSMTAYVPLVPTELEIPLREMVDTVFAAAAGEGEEAAAEAVEQVGVRLVELNCVDRKSLRTSVDILAGALLADPDLRGLDRLTERVVRVIGALSGGFAEAIRKRTADQQDSMCRALMEVTRRAVADAQERANSLNEVNTELTLLQRQLGHQLLHDPLTGLPNRQFFTTRLEEMLASPGPVTLYRLELNGFPLVSDGLGRQGGERLLGAAASRILTAAGESAMVARFDGAHFAILREGPADPEVVDRLNHALSEPAYVEESGLATTANAGVVQCPPHGADPTELLHAADLALRHATRRGPGQWVLHQPDDDADDRRLLRLAAIMPGAWETGQVRVGYRLRVRLADLEPVAVDAFVRWPEAERAGQPRHKCIDLAERTGLSQQLDGWLLRSAGERLRTWNEESGRDLPLTVSLSPNQSSAPTLVDTVLGSLAYSGLPRERLRLAMPAAELFHGREQAATNLTALAEAGVSMAVHDFDGAAGDIVYLEELPLHSVGLSAALASRAVGSPRTSLVVKALTGLVALTHLAGLPVWVDDVGAGEVDWWRAIQVDTAGFGSAGDIGLLF